MNRETRRIAALLGISMDAAWKVQLRMMEDGIDFSECTDAQFRAAARAAFAAVFPGA